MIGFRWAGRKMWAEQQTLHGQALLPHSLWCKLGHIPRCHFSRCGSFLSPCRALSYTQSSPMLEMSTVAPMSHEPSYQRPRVGRHQEQLCEDACLPSATSELVLHTKEVYFFDLRHIYRVGILPFLGRTIVAIMGFVHFRNSLFPGKKYSQSWRCIMDSCE